LRLSCRVIWSLKLKHCKNSWGTNRIFARKVLKIVLEYLHSRNVKIRTTILNPAKLRKNSANGMVSFLCVSINFTEKERNGPHQDVPGSEVCENVNIPAGSSAGSSAVVPNSFLAFRWAKRWCDFVGRARPAIQDDNSRSSGAPDVTGGIPIRPSKCMKWTVVSRAAARRQEVLFPQLIPFASEVALMRELLSKSRYRQMTVRISGFTSNRI